ncbi:cyclin-domain-containing protein [Lipomyces chichibuensis]|uniref:cyclin-domain-containing protein n=1 Tax=Lipomyces chichibuensis TaxID=1546026 RepID=UPI003343A777
MTDYPGGPVAPNQQLPLQYHNSTISSSVSRSIVGSSVAGATGVEQSSPSNSSHTSSTLTSPASDPSHLDILNHPVSEVLVMISALLQRIIEANDALYISHHHHSHDGRARGLASSVLAFHGRNVPAISLQSYLMRILKYCPATNEVFLSLLVYFDRISKRANAGEFSEYTLPAPQQLQQQHQQPLEQLQPDYRTQSVTAIPSAIPATPSSFSSYAPQHGHQPIPHDPPTYSGQPQQLPFAQQQFVPPSPPLPPPPPPQDVFVMDSYNIHRLVIAGVTVASKFFSDVFYKNSRYAKVGGLPLEELNHLELQFLLLSDFRLAIPLEELQRYGDLLLQFWDREVPSHNKPEQQGSSGA